MPRLKTWQNFVAPLILVVSLLALYVHTMAPGLTWANAGSDGGDLITAAATGGIPHPTGYPLYLLVGRLFQLLPVGSLAYRTNLLSALATMLAAALVYATVERALSVSDNVSYWPAGMAAGYAFGLSSLIWSQAVITEVYGLQALLVALILYLYANSAPPFSTHYKSLDCWRGLTLGLAMANHVTVIFLVPIALLIGSIQRLPAADVSSRPNLSFWLGRLKFDSGMFLRQMGMLGAGLLLYFVIPLRAVMDPPVNWGNAVTLKRLWWLVSGELYQNYYLQFTPAEYWGHFQGWATVVLQQFGLAGVLLGLVGLIVFGTPSRLYLLTIWTAIVYTAFAVFYRSADSYVYLMPMILSFSIWIGLSVGGIIRQFSQRKSMFRVALGLVFIVYFVIWSLVHLGTVDASHDDRAETFAGEVLSLAPTNALVFARGDQAVFSLWYYHFALDERPDLIVMATDLLHFDWYQENLQSSYPSLKIPSSFPWPQTIAITNPERTVCYVQYSDQVEMDCSE